MFDLFGIDEAIAGRKAHLEIRRRIAKGIKTIEEWNELDARLRTLSEKCGWDYNELKYNGKDVF